MLTLYFAPGTSSMAPHIALHEIGVKFESCPLSFAKGEQRRSSYLSLNAEGKVPTLMIDGRPLTEVAAILYYLARTYPDAGLLPQDTACLAAKPARFPTCGGVAGSAAASAQRTSNPLSPSGSSSTNSTSETSACPGPSRFAGSLRRLSSRALRAVPDHPG